MGQTFRNLLKNLNMSKHHSQPDSRSEVILLSVSELSTSSRCVDIQGAVLMCVIVHCVCVFNSPVWLITIILQNEHWGKKLNIDDVCSRVTIVQSKIFLRVIFNKLCTK